MRRNNGRGLKAPNGEAARLATGVLTAVTAASLVTGCNGGGGGGSASPAAPAAITIAAAPQDAKTPPASNDVNLAAGLLFPLYPLLTSAGAFGGQEGTRVQSSTGNLTVTYRDSVGAKQVVFTPNQIDTTTVPGILGAVNGTTRYFEVSQDPDFDLSLTHSRFGFLSYQDAGSNQRRNSPFYFGFETPVSRIPTAGFAEYTGRVAGFWNSTDGIPNVQGDIRLRANFDSSRMFGTVSNLEAEDATGTTTPLGITANLVDNGVTGVPITRTAGAPHYQGSLVGTRTVGGTSTGVTGLITGRIFGYDRNETAGNIRLVWDSETLDGSYGATSPGGFISAAGEVLALDSTFKVNSATDVHFPLKTDLGAAGIGARTLGADGKLTVVYPTVEGQNAQGQNVIGKDIVIFAPSDVTTLPDGTLRAQNAAGILYTEYSSIDSVNGDLSYARFGTLQLPQGGGLRSFAFGYATPPAAIPTTGWAEYVGVTNGIYRSAAADEPLSGLVNMRADFADRSVFGRISAIEINPGTTQVRTPNLGFEFDTPSGGITEGKFAGTVARTGERMTIGQILGQFYGPNYDEVAGTWSAALNGTDSISASFGARSTANGPTSVSTWLSFADQSVEQPLTYRIRFNTVASAITADRPLDVGPAIFRSRSDGGIDLRIPVSGGNRDVAYVSTDFTPLDATRTGINRIVQATKDNVHIVVGGANTLSYSRFGYWEDLSAAPPTTLVNFYYAGVATPGDRIPTTGTATYTGATVAQALSDNTVTQLQGQMSMTANFAAKTMTGTLSGFVVTNAAAPGAVSPLSSVTMSGTMLAPGSNVFSGTTTNVTPGQSTNGQFAGQFYGRNAQEIGGVWNVGTTGDRVQAWGAFGGSR